MNNEISSQNVIEANNYHLHTMVHARQLQEHGVCFMWYMLSSAVKMNDLHGWHDSRKETMADSPRE
jgi:hypothetical protein